MVISRAHDKDFCDLFAGKDFRAAAKNTTAERAKGSSDRMEGYQRKYLKGLAHGLKPVVLIGQGGLSASVVRAVDAALNDHELIKIKFNAFREKEEKAGITAAIEKQTGAQWVGSIGHTAIFYRRHPDRQRRRIALPGR